MYWHYDDTLLAECTDIMTTDRLLNELTSWQTANNGLFYTNLHQIALLKEQSVPTGARCNATCWTFHMNSSNRWVSIKTNKAYASHTYVDPLNICVEEVAAPSRRLAAPRAAVYSCRLYIDRSSKQQFPLQTIVLSTSPWEWNRSSYCALWYNKISHKQKLKPSGFIVTLAFTPFIINTEINLNCT